VELDARFVFCFEGIVPLDWCGSLELLSKYKKIDGAQVWRSWSQDCYLGHQPRGSRQSLFVFKQNP
jgi:hypothetical protein